MPIITANLSMMYKEYDFLDRFEAAAKDGFKFVEYLFPYDYEPEAIVEKLKAAGVEQSLFNFYPGDFAKGERGIAALPGREAEFMESIDKAIRYAKATNCKRLHVMAGKVPLDQDGRENITPEGRLAMRKTYLNNLKLAAKAVAPLGITLLIEPINTRDMPGYFLSYQQDAHDIVKEVGEPNLKVLMDLYHAQIVEGDLEMRLRKHYATVGHIQIAGVPKRHEPDVGEVNYYHLFDVLDELGYQGHVGCEYNPRAGTSENLTWLREWRKNHPN